MQSPHTAAGWLVTGGTAFYEQRRVGVSHFGAAACRTLEEGGGWSHLCTDSLAYNCSRGVDGRRECDALTEQRAFTPSYQTASDDNFELLKVVPHAFNRALVYSAKTLHSAYIDDAALKTLSCDPKVGRLTANLFFD